VIQLSSWTDTRGYVTKGEAAMQYVKPAIVNSYRASAAIESHQMKISNNVDSSSDLATATAYEADE
jgi:hypothetical protein